MAPRQQPNEKKRKRNTAVERVEDANRRNVTFSKRKVGLFNKLTELSILCNAETALIISSPNDKIYVCGYPSADAVVSRFVTGSRPPRGGRMNSFHEKIETLRTGYEAAQDELKEEKRKLAEMTEKQKQSGGGALSSLWWEAPIDDMDLDGLVQFKKSVENLRLNLVMRRVSNNHSNDNNVPPPPQPQQHPHLQPLAVENNAPLPPNHPHLQPLSVVLAPKQPEQPVTNFDQAASEYNCHDYSWQQVQSGSQYESGGSSGLTSAFGSSASITSDYPSLPPDYDGGAMVPFGYDDHFYY